MSTPNMNTMKTLSEISNDLKKEGHDLDFGVNDSGKLYIIGENKKTYLANELSLMKSYRFEGMSNPSDTSILYLIKTPEGNSGTLINSYGANSSKNIDEFIKKVNPK